MTFYKDDLKTNIQIRHVHIEIHTNFKNSYFDRKIYTNLSWLFLYFSKNRDP